MSDYTPARRGHAGWFALVAALILGDVALLQRRIDVHTRSVQQQKEELLLQSPTTAKKLSLGYESLLADIYWTRAVQLYGEKIGKTHEGMELLWPLLNISTTLDPKLLPAYHFGAMFLSEPGNGGAGRPDLAVALLKRGIEANPKAWSLGFDLGFDYYWWLRDYSAASQAFLDASKVPGAPSWLELTAARMAQKSGSLETARMIWSQLYDTSKDPRIRKNALAQMESLKAQEDEEQLDDLAEQYRQRFGRMPASTAELHAAGMIPGIPADPEGFPYIFQAGGRASLDPRSPVQIIPLPKILSAPKAPAAPANSNPAAK